VFTEWPATTLPASVPDSASRRSTRFPSAVTVWSVVVSRAPSIRASSGVSRPYPAALFGTTPLTPIGVPLPASFCPRTPTPFEAVNCPRTL